VSDDHFLSRWSRRKHAANRGEAPAEPAPPPASPPATASPEPAGGREAEPTPLPPVESLTTESDFTPFMRSDVDPKLRQQALRTLFRDERFNVMDGLDVYIDDYSQPDPIPADWLGKLNQMARLGDYRPPEESADGEATDDGAALPVENPKDEQRVGVAEPEDEPPPDAAQSPHPG
jgi:hypothetical protein